MNKAFALFDFLSLLARCFGAALSEAVVSAYRDPAGSVVQCLSHALKIARKMSASPKSLAD